MSETTTSNRIVLRLNLILIPLRGKQITGLKISVVGRGSGLIYCDVNCPRQTAKSSSVLGIGPAIAPWASFAEFSGLSKECERQTWRGDEDGDTCLNSLRLASHLLKYFQCEILSPPRLISADSRIVALVTLRVKLGKPRNEKSLSLFIFSPCSPSSSLPPDKHKWEKIVAFSFAAAIPPF